MSQQMVARYYLLPNIGRLSLCTVESGYSSHGYLAIYSACSSLTRATTRLMVRVCEQLVLWEYQHTLSIVQTLFHLTLFRLTLFCLPSVLPALNCSCAHKTAGRYNGELPRNVL